MKSVFFIALALTLTAGAWARKPAVEDFVGIESTIPDTTPEGTKTLFNFEQEVAEYAGRSNDKSALVVHHTVQKTHATQTTWPWTTWAGIFLVLGLPVGTWALTMRHLKSRKASTEGTVVPLPIRAKSVASDDIKKSA